MKTYQPTNPVLHIMIAVLVGLCVMIDRSIYLDEVNPHHQLDWLGRHGLHIDFTLGSLFIGGIATFAYAVTANLPRPRHATGIGFMVYLLATWSVIRQSDLHGAQLVVFEAAKLGGAWFVASVAASILYVLNNTHEPPVSSDVSPHLHLVP